MERTPTTTRTGEQVSNRLRQLYDQYGYRRFRMSKFEEYDFYQANRDFLGGGQILTFTDGSGKLMALKPDVTMSIVKHTRATPAQPEKVHYSESVYRTGADAREFKEISQIGVEYIGSMSGYAQAEMVALACRSLACMEQEYVLDLSHMGIVNGLLEGLELPSGGKRALLSCIESKNAHELAGYIEAYGIGERAGACLLLLVRLSGTLPEALAALAPYIENGRMEAAYRELETLAGIFEADAAFARLRLDFSVTAASKYYNGLMLRGYIQSVPRAVLFGGQYDPLLQRMGKPELQAIGFGIYFEEVERILKAPVRTGYDAAVLYSDTTDLALMHAIVSALTAKGLRVYTGAALPPMAEAVRVYPVTQATLREVQP